MKFLLLMGVALGLGGFVRAEVPKIINVYSSFDTPGYNEIDTLGNKTGYEIDLTNAIFSSQGYKVNWLVKSWGDIVDDLSQPSYDKDYIYVASIEAKPERRINWLFATASEYDASHYFFAKPQSQKFKTGDIIDSKTRKVISGFILDIKDNKINGQKLRIATWKGSAFEEELHRSFPELKNIEIIAMENGDPISWLKDDVADVVYAFASGPINSYTNEGYSIVAGPIANFDLDRFSGTSPALPMNSFGQSVNRVWMDGFAAILKDDTFFKISMHWFGRVSWPDEFNNFMVSDIKAFKKRAKKFENSYLK